MAGVFNAQDDLRASDHGDAVKDSFPCYYMMYSEYDVEPEAGQDKDLEKYKELAEQAVAELEETSAAGSTALWSGEEHESTRGDK
eukprot:763384-Hanusia_phi.AAC.2